ncbi:wax ester/triacylglycerol synthase domain-containing protein [Rhodococcus spelaei]|nr:wax ester/triacylglycerol synthase domain-containing protein [Rhodococcus spelaei]
MVATLHPRDAAHIYAEDDRNQASVLDAYVLGASEHDLSHSGICAWLEPRLRSSPILTSRLSRVPLDLDYPAWDPDPGFAIAEHVTVVEVGNPGKESLRHELGGLLASPMDLSVSPWHLYVFTNVRGVLGITEGDAIAVLKFHHSVGDAMTTAELAERMFGSRIDGTDDPAVGPATQVNSRLVALVRAIATAPHAIIRFGMGMRDSRRAQRKLRDKVDVRELALPPTAWPKTRFNVMFSGSSVVDVVSFDLAAVRQICRRMPGVTVNDVVMTVIAGAMSTYLEEKGEHPEGPMGAKVPISLRKVEESDANNRFALASVDLGAHATDQRKRLEFIHTAMLSEKARCADETVRGVEGVGETVPLVLMKLMMVVHRRSAREIPDMVAGGSTMISNVRRSDAALTVCGAPVVGGFGLLTLADGNGLNHFVTSVGRDLTIGVTADVGALPEIDHYSDLLRESFAQLVDAVDEPGR